CSQSRCATRLRYAPTSRIVRAYTCRMLDRLFRAAAWLVLPLALLLFAQWPLRDLVQAYSREANDLAQVVFALYMAVAVSAATRANVHLSAGHHAPRVTTRRAWALFACV